MLLDEIISILSDPNGSLTGALLKTKVLLRQIKRKDLAEWVNKELAGYPDDDKDIPPYRHVSMQVRGNLVAMTFRAQSQNLPIKHLEAEYQKFLTSYAMPSSITILEESIKKQSPENKMVRSLPVEANSQFSKALADGVHVTSAWCEINMNDVGNILVEVRSRLLDFVLDLRDVVGEDADEKQLEQKAANIDTGKLFNTAIYGSGNTVVLGIHSSQTVAVTNKKGDIEGLVQAFADAGIPDDELTQLRVAIAEDEDKKLTPVVSEGKTGAWFTNLLSRAGSKTIDIGVDVISSIVVKAIAAYNGIPI